MEEQKKKRPYQTYEQDLHKTTESSSSVSVGANLAHVQKPGVPDIRGLENGIPNFDNGQTDGGNNGNGEWKVVDKRSKKRKTNKNKNKGSQETATQGQKKDNRPTLTHAELHKLQSSLKISNLQGLVIYCLADGVSPQWISVRHHGQVRKAVVLMVPGLERDMFDGQIKLSATPSIIGSDETVMQVGEPNDLPPSRPKEFLGGPIMTQSDSPDRVSNRSPDDYLPVPLIADKLSEPLKPLVDMFKLLWPVKAPGDDKYYKVHSPLHAMLVAQIPKSQDESKTDKKYKGAKPVRDGKEWKDERTPITTFIATNEELQENEYFLHPACFTTQQEKDAALAYRQNVRKSEEHGWKDTEIIALEDADVPGSEIESGSLTAGRIILAMDCEMCKVEGGELELTRISIVGWDGDAVMDELVKPEKKIIDYLTPYSGITPEKLAPVTTTLSDIQLRLLSLLTPRTIILGHSLNADLTALKITHPFIIDTAIIYQHPRGPPLKSSLKWLAQKYLNREIQKGHGTMGHDSIEDAKACLDLIRKKCEKGIKWGTTEATGESIFKRLSRSPKTGVSTMSTERRDGKTGAIVDHGTPEKSFANLGSMYIGCATDDEVVTGVARAVKGDEDGAVIPGGGVDFTWARFRELEAFRGWSTYRTQQYDTGHEYFSENTSPPEPSQASLSTAVSRTVQQIINVHSILPPCTLFIVYSGTGDPREVSRLQEMQKRFRREYTRKKWDELSVKWTDTEEQELRRACKKARAGIGLVVVT